MRAKRVGLLWRGVQHTCTTGEKEMCTLFSVLWLGTCSKKKINIRRHTNLSMRVLCDTGYLRNKDQKGGKDNMQTHPLPLPPTHTYDKF